MHKLGRGVRFSLNPFLSAEVEGYNSYASKPTGEGLSIFLELYVELVGEIEPATGFVVNVTDIDRCVRRCVVPIFSERVRGYFRQSKHIGFFDIAELLKLSWRLLADKFGSAKLSKLNLALNPFRRVAIGHEGAVEDFKMIYFSEKFEFAAMHKLWNEDFSRERNLQVFGKCANPTGHGHNYIVEVTIKTPTNDNSFQIGEFERIVDDKLIKPLDHKNLNADVAQFRDTNPTVENIASFAWKRLNSKFGEATLHCVTVWETDKTYCSYCE